MSEQMTATTIATGRLTELESTIELGLKTFVAVGSALREISEGKLYREQGFTTFEEYCKGRWGWSRFTGYQYIRAAEVAANVELTQQNSPSFTQAFELSSLTPEQQREVASRVDFANSTVADVREQVRLVRGPKLLPAPKEVLIPESPIGPDVKAGNKLQINTGHWTIGRKGHDEIHIFPSTHDGYFYVTRIFADTPNGPAFAEGTKKPLRRDTIECAVFECLRFPTEGVEWTILEAGPLDHNMWLEDRKAA